MTLADSALSCSGLGVKSPDIEYSLKRILFE